MYVFSILFFVVTTYIALDVGFTFSSTVTLYPMMLMYPFILVSYKPDTMR